MRSSNIVGAVAFALLNAISVSAHKCFSTVTAPENSLLCNSVSDEDLVNKMIKESIAVAGDCPDVNHAHGETFGRSLFGFWDCEWDWNGNKTADSSVEHFLHKEVPDHYVAGFDKLIILAMVLIALCCCCGVHVCRQSKKSRRARGPRLLEDGRESVNHGTTGSSSVVAVAENR